MFFEEILNFLYKKSCLICHSKKENSFLCSKCKNKIEYNNFSVLKEINNVKVYSCCIYAGIPQKLVRLLKFHKKKSLAEDISKLIFDYIKNLNEDFSEYEIICVPLHKNKLKKRGFNQCELISLNLSKILDIPYNFNLIKRIRDTKSMYKLKRIERLENLKDAFSVDKKFYNGKKILLIDDITTTGTTLEEMIKELKKNDINDIVCLAFTNTESGNTNIK